MGASRLTIDPVHDLLIVSGGDDLRIFDRTAAGNTPPLRVITGPAAAAVSLLTSNPENGMIFGVVRPGGRFALEDYVGVWSVFDDGPTPPRWTIGGPDFLLKDARGVTLDVRNQNVMVSDKTHNAIFTFHVPEAFQ